MALYRKQIFLVLIFVSLLTVVFLHNLLNNPLPRIPTAKEAEATQELFKKLHKIAEKAGIREIEIPQELPTERLKKLQKELSGILEKTGLTRPGVQYILVATQDGFYPSYSVGGMIFLERGEIWKYGKTCIGKDKRYRDLKQRRLIFVPQFKGTELQCLIVEKIKIYSYLVHPENTKRAKETKTLILLRPPGNKIDR